MALGTKDKPLAAENIFAIKKSVKWELRRTALDLKVSPFPAVGYLVFEPYLL
jgi:hypothetical protein